MNEKIIFIFIVIMLVGVIVAGIAFWPRDNDIARIEGAIIAVSEQIASEQRKTADLIEQLANELRSGAGRIDSIASTIGRIKEKLQYAAIDNSKTRDIVRSDKYIMDELSKIIDGLPDGGQEKNK